MATVRPKRPCAHPGCMAWALPGRSYCEKHQAEWEARQEAEKAKRKEARAEAERERNRRRGTSAQRGYNTAWSRARKAYILRHPICAICGAPATDVDHIKPHKGDKRLFWDSTNWQPLCHRCHARKTYKENLERFTFGKKKKQEGIDDEAMGIYYIP